MSYRNRPAWQRPVVWLVAAVVCGAVVYAVVLRSPGRTEFTPLAPRTIPLANDLRRGYQGGSDAPAPPQARSFKIVDLNEASLEELQTLPQITAEYARKIVAERPYRSIPELARTGIPREILDQISPPGVIRLPERGGPVATPSRGGIPPARGRAGQRP
jgi:hypothetical protein